jgi:hypothetical protein
MAKKKKAPAARMNTLAAKVFAETAFETGAGMQEAMGGKLYFLDPDARDYWLTKHAVSIPKALKISNGDWEHDRTVVLPRAHDLGQFAAEFALADAGSTVPVQVTKKHVKAASIKVNKDKRCRAGRIVGGGGYCSGS